MERIRHWLGHAHALKLSLSLALLVLSVLFLADLFALRGNPLLERQSARKIVAESLAVQLSTLASVADGRALQHALSEFVRRNDIITAASLVRTSGETLAQYGDATQLVPNTTRSTSRHMVVPIYEHQAPWGTVRVAFVPLARLRTDILYFGFLFTGSFLLFLLFLKRALMQLDPSKAVPGRVNSAFNLFSEGVVIIDSSQRIMLANHSAARMINETPESQVGKYLDNWPWVRDERWQSPWARALSTGISVTDSNLYLEQGETRLILVSCTLVGDEDPERSGVMITLSDMTALQKKNRELSLTLNQLRKSQESISQKNQELEELATLDPLTGLLNRRSLMHQFGVSLDRATRESSPISAIMLDIDHFKAVNDSYGHSAGDEVICAVARNLTLYSRTHDLVGRYGGEEFVVVLPNTSAREARELAERIRLEVELMGDDVTVPVPKLSISCGLAERESPDETQESLLERADQALYAAKNSGRNRVVSHNESTLAALADTREVNCEPGVADVERSDRADQVQALVDQHNKEVEKLKSHDWLTGMPRRQLFMHAVESEVLRAERFNRVVGVLSIEIKDLSRLATTLGHTACEALVMQFVERIQEGLRASDLVTQVNDAHSISHLTDNEYGVLLSDLNEADEALPVVTRIRRLMLSPLELDGEKIYIGCNIGIAVFPDNGENAQQMLDSAIAARIDAATNPDKVTHCFASRDLENLSREYLQIESDLYTAVQEGQFDVYFQPKFDLSKRQICGVEALVRWFHPSRGFISPDSFIPIAEANGLIRPLFRIVLAKSLKQLKAWDAQQLTPIGVSVNISASQLRDTSLVTQILTALKQNELSPRRLEVELTETSVIQSPQRAKVALGQLRDAGVGVSMDDFGTGYTSLALLAELPLDAVKIDRSFIGKMESSERSRAIVESVINMAHTLRLHVVAEGVETTEQLNSLTLLGCNEVQGYLISRPQPGSDIANLLHQDAESRALRKPA